jgi:hypothetical protein
LVSFFKWRRQLEGLNTRVINKLDELLDSDSDEMAFKAAKEILNRNLGKPRLVKELDMHVQMQVTHGQWLERLSYSNLQR